MYFASFDSTGTGVLDTIVMFDTTAQGRMDVRSAARRRVGAVLCEGMPINAAVECRGPGDTFQFFWGSSKGDLVAQHDVGTYDDFGSPIQMEVRTKSLFFDQPASKKIVYSVYPVLVFPTSQGGFTSTVTPYVLLDQGPVVDSKPAHDRHHGRRHGYGTAEYSTFVYSNSQEIVQDTIKSYPQIRPMDLQGFSVAFGLTEQSTHPVAVISFLSEVGIEPPQP